MGRTKQFIEAVEKKVPTSFERVQAHMLAIGEMASGWYGSNLSAGLTSAGMAFASTGNQIAIMVTGIGLGILSIEDWIRYMHNPDKNKSDDKSGGSSWTWHEKTCILGVALSTTALASAAGIIPFTLEGAGVAIGNLGVKAVVFGLGFATEVATLSPIIGGLHRGGKHMVNIHTKVLGSLFRRNKVQVSAAQEVPAVEAQAE